MRIWLLCGVVVLAGAAYAHEEQEAVTRVLFNDRTGNIEVMHRFLLHDAEHAMGQIAGRTVDLLNSGSDRQAFAAYVAQKFVLLADAGEPLPLARVGEELDGRYLWVYAEVPQPATVRRLTVQHDALREVWPQQVNLVNIEHGAVTRSLLFEKGAARLSADLVPH